MGKSEDGPRTVKREVELNASGVRSIERLSESLGISFDTALEAFAYIGVRAFKATSDIFEDVGPEIAGVIILTQTEE